MWEKRIESLNTIFGLGFAAIISVMTICDGILKIDGKRHKFVLVASRVPSYTDDKSNGKAQRQR